MNMVHNTALIYCEKQFGLIDGKTASGLIRQSNLYKIVGVIDSSLTGKDAGEVLGLPKNNIPIYADLSSALADLNDIPQYYIYGKAPLDARIPSDERLLILDAIRNGMNIVNGLHEFFSDDSEFMKIARQYNVTIRDIRKPPSLNDLHVFTGQIAKVDVPVIAILGTDCACGKMTTMVELNKTLNRLGVKSVMIATGQTSLMQGTKYGVSIDALVSQFVIGEIENAVVQAFEQEKPDIILVEGQSSVGHPAFMSSVAILKGSMPDGVILQHPPGRKVRCDFPTLAMPTIESEIHLIETISQSKVLAIALNHENLSPQETLDIISDYEHALKLPTTDILSYGCQKLVNILREVFPQLNKKMNSQIKAKENLLMAIR